MNRPYNRDNTKQKKMSFQKSSVTSSQVTARSTGKKINDENYVSEAINKEIKTKNTKILSNTKS